QLDNLRRELLRRSPVHQLIAGDLFGEEPVPWLIVVDGLDHIVAITPHAFGELGFGGVEILSRGVYIAGGVEPQTSPSLAVPRPRQQAVEQTLIGVRTRIGQESPDLFGRRRQAG